MLGKDNAAAVQALVGAAATLDRAYCGQLQGLALLSRARRLLANAGSGDSVDGGAEEARQQLLALLTDEPALAIARDMEGRSLWHDLAVTGSDALLRLMLPAAAATGSGDAEACVQEQQGAAEQHCQVEAQQQAHQQPAGMRASSRAAPPNPLNLPDHNGQTPLHLAAEASRLEAARLLVQAGASLDMQNRWAGAGRHRRGRCRSLRREPRGDLLDAAG